MCALAVDTGTLTAFPVLGPDNDIFLQVHHLLRSTDQQRLTASHYCSTHLAFSCTTACLAGICIVLGTLASTVQDRAFVARATTTCTIVYARLLLGFGVPRHTAYIVCCYCMQGLRLVVLSLVPPWLWHWAVLLCH